jgi:hypothetical protein
MMADSSEARRKLRKAEMAVLIERGLAEKSGRGRPETLAELEASGIIIGEGRTLTPAELLAELEREGEGETRPTITITVYLDDTPVEDRGQIEDPLSEFVAESGIGEWLGSGQGRIGECRFFDVAFAVTDLDSAIPLIQRKLKDLGAGAMTTLTTNDGGSYQL